MFELEWLINYWKVMLLIGLCGIVIALIQKMRFKVKIKSMGDSEI